MRVAFGAACVLSVVGLAAGAARAQVRDWATATNGNWNNAANWSPANIPDTVGESANIGLIGSYVVTANNFGAFTVGSLAMPRANPVLTITGGADLTVGNTGITCNGAINIVGTPTSGESQLILLGLNAPVDGTGVIELDADPSLLASARVTNSVGSIALATDMTIRGDGAVFAAVTNNGTISANHAGERLQLLSTITNAGALRALNGGILGMGGGVTSIGGTITSNNSLIEFTGGLCSSCVIEGINGGAINLAGPGASATFSGTTVFLSGDFMVESGGTARISGGAFNNFADVRVYPGSGASPAKIECLQTTTLSNAGSLMLNAPVANRSLAQLNTSSPVSMTIANAGGHTLGGTGLINCLVTNTGILKPGVAGSVGVLEFQDRFISQVGSTMEFDIYGRNPGQYDTVLFSTSTAGKSINGILRMVCKPGYIPETGDSFVIITATAGTITGAFSAVEVTGTPRTVSASVVRTSTTVTVTFDHVCRGIDFNNDSLFPDTQDITDFLNVFAGGACSTGPGNCDPIDFNTDTLFPDTLDIDAFLSVFAGGPCL